MRDLHVFVTNPFDDPNISMNELIAFALDHQARLIANNPGAVFAERITATGAVLTAVESTHTDDETQLALRRAKVQLKEAFRNALPAAIGKIHGAVQSQFGDPSAEMTECFPQGLSAFSRTTDGDLAEQLQVVINGVTKLQPPLAASVITDVTALLTGWNTAFSARQTATGGKSSSKDAKLLARAALQLELYKNLLTIGLNFPRQAQALDTYMQQSLLSPHTQSPAAPAPPPAPAA